ncbi:hypothetical protein D1AOALGA4SA_6611 [Olavius algarvensis Delta 1 endosymbiont]|nr:hypothetical protein D1AOALGA4SA_6611 [Olavius algarvensis Delta 1 endosymbiont]
MARGEPALCSCWYWTVKDGWNFIQDMHHIEEWK